MRSPLAKLLAIFLPPTVTNAGQLPRIQQKIYQLRRLDKKFKIFGASTHRYRMGAPLTEASLSTIEKKYGFTLPADYREFLAAVGNGGCGPFYGLFALDKKDKEDITDVENLSNSFPWTDAYLEMKTDTEGVPIYEMPPGVLYICHEGCALRFFLVISGPCRGQVWRDYQADGRGISPVTSAAGERLGFLEWYEQWLDVSLQSENK